MTAATWTLTEAVELCTKIEEYCPSYGCHVALTGGTLYKSGPRKDCDILFYPIRPDPEIDFDGLWHMLRKLGLVPVSLPVLKRWCVKATYDGKAVDVFFADPAISDGAYT